VGEIVVLPGLEMGDGGLSAGVVEGSVSIN
jgi:hypothetical protein